MRAQIFFLIAVFCATLPVVAQNDSKWCWPANSPYDQCYNERKYNYNFCFGNQIVEVCTEFPNDMLWPYKPLKADLDILCVKFAGFYPFPLDGYPGGIKMPSKLNPNFNISVWQRGQENNYIDDALASWKCLCPPQNPPFEACCIEVEYTDNPRMFPDATNMAAVTHLAVNFAACEIDCNTTKILLNVTKEFTSYDPVGFPDTPFQNFFYTTGGYPPAINTGNNANYSVVYLFDVIRHEIGHLFGLEHHDACGPQGPNGRPNSGIMNAEGVQSNAPPAGLTQDDVCAYKRLYCPDVVTGAGPTYTQQYQETVAENSYPNPFSVKTTIPFVLTQPGYVTLSICDQSGQTVHTLLSEFRPAGSYKEVFDGQHLPQGVYWYLLQFNNDILSRKMLLIK